MFILDCSRLLAKQATSNLYMLNLKCSKSNYLAFFLSRLVLCLRNCFLSLCAVKSSLVKNLINSELYRLMTKSMTKTISLNFMELSRNFKTISPSNFYESDGIMWKCLMCMSINKNSCILDNQETFKKEVKP